MEKQRGTGGPAGAIIGLGMAVALACNTLGILDSRHLVKEAAGETAAVNAAAQEGFFDGFQQLDDPLLVLVNEEVPVPEDWRFLPYLVDDEVVDRRMAEDLSAMLQAAEADGVWLWVASAYRGEERQGVLFEREVEKNLQAGMEEAEARQDALRTVALPGRSEHQTGLAVDFNDVSQNFQRTEAYQWLQRHGAEYGFVQRYQKEKESVTGVSEEPWHYRYVGRAHAGRMEKGRLCLEEYVISLGDS